MDLRAELGPGMGLVSRSRWVDTIEERLPETECPGRTVTVLDVSFETKDKGRGMNSRVSEKPTRVRGARLAEG
jgi:hypothetical protein